MADPGQSHDYYTVGRHGHVQSLFRGISRDDAPPMLPAALPVDGLCQPAFDELLYCSDCSPSEALAVAGTPARHALNSFVSKTR